MEAEPSPSRLAARNRDAVCEECRAHLVTIYRECDEDTVVAWAIARAEPKESPDFCSRMAYRLGDAPRVACPLCFDAGQYGFGFVHPGGLTRHLDGAMGAHQCSVVRFLQQEARDRDHRRISQRIDAQVRAAELGCIPSARPEYVYLIAAEALGHVKIGVSVSPAARLKSLATSHSTELRLLRSSRQANAYALERELHQRFQHLRVAREWFRDDPTIHQAFQELGEYEAAA
jgi:hypothetical protein